MNKPLVSVVIPTYGGAEFLKRCVDSVLSQTYPNIEIIVVDDNGVGTPNQLSTAKVMEEYENTPSVKYVCHKVNINGSAARNTGVRNSKGEYIALLDDDDVFYPNNIEEHMKILPNLDDSYALTYCSGIDEFIDTGVKRKMIKTFTGQDLYAILMHDVTISSTTICIKRKAWNALGGFDETFRRHQDWEFTARVMDKYKVYALQHIGYKRYRIQRNATNDPAIKKKYIMHYLNSLMPIINTLPASKRQDVLIKNRFGVCLSYLRKRRFLMFIKEWFNISPGYRGFLYLFQWIINGLNHKRYDL